MQSLIALMAVCICIPAVAWIKNYRYSFVASLRIFVKRLALFVISFSWVLVLATLLVIACYANLSGLLKEVLSANSIRGIKSLLRLVFGADSAFAALQMLAFYSIMANFVSCLVLSLGIGVRNVYRTVLKVARTNFIEDNECFEEFNQRSLPTFKLYLKYNS